MQSKVKVKVESFKGWLRLRWSCAGERYSLALGLPDSKVNRTVAAGKAAVIEGDLATENFDPSLTKYRPKRQTAESSLSILELLERFTEVKKRKILSRTLSKFRALHEPINQFFGSKPAAVVDDDLADQFRVYLVQSRGLAPATVKERLVTLNACWKWGLKQGLVASNPWSEVTKVVTVPPTQKPKPFSQTEIAAILKALRDSKHYAHYADFVEFRFGCGCRIEEAIGLKWCHLSDDCSNVWIGEAVSRGKIRKTTKTNRARQFKLSPRLQQVLLARRPEQWRPDDLVFPAPRGGEFAMWDSGLLQNLLPRSLAEVMVI